MSLKEDLEGKELIIVGDFNATKAQSKKIGGLKSKRSLRKKHGRPDFCVGSASYAIKKWEVNLE